MPETIEDFRGSADYKRLKELWAAAVVPIDPPPAQDVGQALAFGLNFRVHIIKALQAAWETAHVAIRIIADQGAFDPATWLEISAEVFGAAHTIFASLVQRMRPIDYISCVILSAHPQGMTGTELQEAVTSFLAKPDQKQFSWYLRLSDGPLERAKDVTNGRDWFPAVLQSLRKYEFLDEDQGTLNFHPRHYTVGWKGD